MLSWLRSRIGKHSRIEQPPKQQPLTVKRAPGSSTTRGITKPPLTYMKAHRRRANKLASASRKTNR